MAREQCCRVTVDGLFSRLLVLMRDASRHKCVVDSNRSSLGLRRFSGVMTIVIIIMGVLGNALTIAALIKCPKIRNVTVAFITRLIHLIS